MLNVVMYAYTPANMNSFITSTLWNGANGQLTTTHNCSLLHLWSCSCWLTRNLFLLAGKGDINHSHKTLLHDCIILSLVVLLQVLCFSLWAHWNDQATSRLQLLMQLKEKHKERGTTLNMPQDNHAISSANLMGAINIPFEKSACLLNPLLKWIFIMWSDLLGVNTQWPLSSNSEWGCGLCRAKVLPVWAQHYGCMVLT